MQIQSLDSWKNCLKDIEKHPETCFFFKKETQGFKVAPFNEIKKGSLLTFSKVVSISKSLLDNKQDAALAILVGKHVYTAAVKDHHLASPFRFLYHLVERIKNFVLRQGFITNVQQGRNFVIEQLNLQSVASQLRELLITELRKKTPSASNLSTLIPLLPASLQNVFKALSTSDPLEVNFFLWLFIEKIDLHTPVSFPEEKKPLTLHQFVGTDALKLKQQKHLEKLKILAQQGRWDCLQKHTLEPDSGFDWWMFPTNWESSSYKKAYQLDDKSLRILEKDPEFMQSFKDGVSLVAKSWGWDIYNKAPFNDPDLKWVGYNIRLEKMIHSLYLFQEQELLASLKLFISSNKIELGKWV